MYCESNRYKLFSLCSVFHCTQTLYQNLYSSDSDKQKTQQQATKAASPPQKSNLISCDPLDHISDIKLIRTDTTLDLSQKAEKGMT
ncbi:hypothetical protein MTR_5g019820 [Medicago truncatula]|uniref:Uncharacterized protein n=1 Tax=Medicago truncatula TaxID=3880 RepID=G7I6L0_MEDTR|nr:hypothetical protein MTR_5g019820 [Medicago truncatula]